MPDIQFFSEKLLSLFARKKEYYRNIFGASHSYLAEILKRSPGEEDLIAAQRAFYDLRNRGYIFDVNGEHYYELTEAGREALSSGYYKTSAGKRLIEFISDSRVLEVSGQAFDGGRFPDSVFLAAKMLEVLIRNKAALAPEVIGKDVVIDAFSPQRGKLIVPMCETESEKEGVLCLFKGVIAFLKNPESHRYTDWITHEVAVKALQTIEFSLKLVDSSVIK